VLVGSTGPGPHEMYTNTVSVSRIGIIRRVMRLGFGDPTGFGGFEPPSGNARIPTQIPTASSGL